MDEQSAQMLQLATASFLVGASHTGPTVLQAHGVTTNNGHFVLAGGNVNIQQYYNTDPESKLNILSVLRLVTNLRNIHLNILSKATPGTGIWLLTTKYFILWLDPNGDIKILWGSGIPGAGKSVMASIVINELEARAAAAGGSMCVCYIYFRYSDGADLTIRNILEILVKQTLERHPDCASLSEETYSRHLRENTQPTEAELLRLLQRFIGAKSATFYILDALDEAPDLHQVDIIQKLASLDVRLFITSRPLKAVEARVPNVHSFPIVAQEGDLDLHIAQEIARSRDLANLLDKAGPSLKREIVSLIKSKCSGMFLHASLQLDALCECATAHDVRRTLAAFPSKIEDVHRQTWQRILEQKSSNVLLAKAVLVWVLNASRSMTIEELECAVATSRETHKFEPDRLAPGTTLIALCRGLVTLEEESRLVRLVHYTAKDTLQELLRNSFPHPHSHLAMVCITHLAECGFQNTTLRSVEDFSAALKGGPLLAYASDAWVFHARQSLNVEDTRRRIANFISECNAYPTFVYLDIPETFDVLRPLHILAIHNLPVSFIPHGNIGCPNVVTHICQDSPLSLASWLGHEDIVKLLLTSTETDVNLGNGHEHSALMLAAGCGHDGIVKLLLARSDVHVNLVDGGGRSALMLAAVYGHEGTTTLLLACSEVQVNLVSNYGWSALMLATQCRHDGTVKLLLAHPEIQVNLVDNKGCSTLMQAIMYGNETIVKLLLAHPEIQVDLVDREGWSVLLNAAYHGREGISRLLLSLNEINVNLVDQEGWSALILAASRGYEGVVGLLLARPEIQINLVNNEGWSALMLASINGHTGVIKLLLAHPETMVNLTDTEGWSALMKAARHGHEDAVALFIAHSEILVNLVSNRGFSALMLAVNWEHEAVVRLLLGVPHVNTTTRSIKDGHTALSIALTNGYMSIVKLLEEFEFRQAGDKVDMDMLRTVWEAIKMRLRG